MSTSELSLERIRQLYTAYIAQNHWPNWVRSYREEVEKFRAMDDAQLRTPEAQDALWSAQGIATLGSGEHVNIGAAIKDSDIVERIVALRSRRWSDDPNKRSKEFQAAYDEILGLVRDRHSKQRPQARLTRLFVALLPAHLTAAISHTSSNNLWRLLIAPRRCSTMAVHILVRARLRHALGEETGLDDHVHRGQFCWWLHEHWQLIQAGETPEGGGTEPEPEPEVSEALPPLALQTFNSQVKGIAAIAGYIDAYRAVVQAAAGGATPEDIVETMRSDLGFEKFGPKYCRTAFNRVRRLGFLTHREGLWYPSVEGTQLVDEDPPDVLVEKLLVHHFGVAWLLRILDESGPIARKDVFEQLRAVYPNWTTDFTPSALMGWADSLGLYESLPDGRRQLSDYGRMWARRLPEALPRPEPGELPGPAPTGDSQGGDQQPDTPSPDLDAIQAAFQSDESLSGFVFDPDQLRALHTAWHCSDKKRFVILSGLSGTGKTAVLLHYARLYCQHMGLEPDAHLAVVPVSPDWRDPSGLLGYFNALHADPTFQAEPALALILAAARNPTLPYFLVLDEMNLARVERYFAPFLSAMETGDRLQLHAQEEPVNQVPASVPWPDNLRIGGTVNMDETTHPFSDKVLDRAFTLEFWDVDLASFFARRGTSGDRRQRREVEAFLVDFNDVLRRIRRHFGYRSAGEILDFLDAAIGDRDYDDTQDRALLDQAVFSKVLPRLRGADSGPLRQALADALALCGEHQLRRCADKLTLMRERLEESGVTRFWS